jgi:adenylosuccinate lyase
MISRYTRPEMGHIWEPENRFRRWLDVELAVVAAMAELGQIPAQAAEEIAARATFDVSRINAIEQETRHDVIAFLTCVAERVGPAARYLHLGLTSSDVLDTSLALLLREAADLILKDLDDLLAVLKRRAFEHRDTVMIGRSHGVHAEPVTFGLKLALWYAEMARNRERVLRARESINVGNGHLRERGSAGGRACLRPPGAQACPDFDPGHPAGSPCRVLQYLSGCRQQRGEDCYRDPSSPAD